jgi:hypothetical protein
VFWLITIYFYVNANGKVVKVFPKNPDKKDERYTLKSIEFIMKPLTWGLYRELNKQCARKGNLNDIDYLLMKEKKIVNGIMDWNIKDDKGNKIEISKENIFNLHPMIVETLANEYDERSYISKKERRDITLSINKYYLSAIAGTGQVSTPPEVVELSLMEKFNWAPNVIDEIPYKRIQELFLILNQREISSENAQNFKQGNKK